MEDAFKVNNYIFGYDPAKEDDRAILCIGKAEDPTKVDVFICGEDATYIYQLLNELVANNTRNQAAVGEALAHLQDAERELNRVSTE